MPVCLGGWYAARSVLDVSLKQWLDCTEAHARWLQHIYVHVQLLVTQAQAGTRRGEGLHA